jgi:phospholipid/cholesterol/gamma-HCH transport system substrate-binding protein
MRSRDPHRRLKVGLFTVVTLALVALSVLVLGRKQGLFVRHVTYTTRFAHVAGLVPGAPVWLNGVVVGSVDDVQLPEDPAHAEITAVLSVNARVAGRIRADSRVRLRTLGLLGDRYLEVTSGTPDQPAIEPGGQIPSETMEDLASVLAKGGDAMSNVVTVSASLRKILERVERGEGVVGELVMAPDSGGQTGAHLASAVASVDAILTDLKAGKGTLGRLLRDDELGKELTANLEGFARAAREVSESLARDLKRDDSIVAGLLRDPQGRARLTAALQSVDEAAGAIRDVGTELKSGEGTLGRLIHDKDYAKGLLQDLARLTAALASVSEKLDHGQGSAAQVINDPQLYRDLENVVRGVKESKTISWLVRSRREAGERAAAQTTPTPVTTGH